MIQMYENNNMANIFFIIYFPSFLIYHILLAYDIITPFLGGYSVIITLVLFVPTLKLLINFDKKVVCLFSKKDIFFYSFLIYFLIILVFNFIKGTNETILLEHAIVIIEFLVVYLIFRTFNLTDRKVLIFSYLIFLIVPFFTLNVLDKFQGNVKSIATYQDIAFFYNIILIVLLVNTEKSYKRFFIYIFSFVFLYLLGSRSEFISLFLIFFLNEFYISKNRFLFLMVLFSIFMIVLLIVFINIDKIIEILPDSRVKYIISTGLSLDASNVERNQFLDAGLQIINSNVIFGAYASYKPGNYIHNIFSAWVDLGIIGFINIFVFIFYSLFYVNRFVIIKHIKNKYLHFLFLVTYLVIFMVFFLKNFIYLGIPIMWAIFASISQNKFQRSEVYVKTLK